MYYIIYKITNIVNNKIYIGKHKTNDLNDGYMGSGKYLHYSQNKHGIEKFKKDILYKLKSESEMNEKEANIVNEEFIARLDTYNIMLGGAGGWSYINENGLRNGFEKTNPNTIEHQEHARNAFKQKLKNNKEFYNNWVSKLSNARKLHIKIYGHNLTGTKHTKETKEKISKSAKGKHIGRLNSQYGTCWIINYELKKNKKIKKEELQNWINKGWCKGRKFF